jgi:hypothetical protein
LRVIAVVTLRHRCPPVSPELERKDYGPIKPGDYGGAEAFHHFMMEELRARIRGLYRVDLHNQSLMGYSLGGLFALHVLFEQPDSYSTFVVGSPSIWWNDREVLLMSHPVVYE